MPELLGWAAAELEGSFSPDRNFERLTVGAVERAFAWSDDPAVLDALADVVARLLSYLRLGSPWAQDDVRRRQLAVAVADRLDDHNWHLMLRSGLVTEADVAWLSDEAGARPAKADGVLEMCLAHLVGREFAALTPPSDDEEDEEGETGRRAEYERLKAAIAAARDDVTTWWSVTTALAGEDPYTESLFTCDLADRPGWSLLADDDRQEVFDLGLKYVLEHAPTPDDWFGKATVSLEVLRDWSGLYLLTTLAKHDPGRLSAVPLAVWSSWAPVVSGAWAYGSNFLLKDLVKLAPAEAKTEVLTALQHDLDARVEWRQSPLYELFAGEVAPVLAERLQQRRYDDEQSVALLGFLIQHSPDSATDVCRAVAVDDGSPLPRAASRHLAGIDPRARSTACSRKRRTARYFWSGFRGWSRSGWTIAGSPGSPACCSTAFPSPAIPLGASMGATARSTMPPGCGIRRSRCWPIVASSLISSFSPRNVRLPRKSSSVTTCARRGRLRLTAPLCGLLRLSC